jgi:hypothetical protein
VDAGVATSITASSSGHLFLNPQNRLTVFHHLSNTTLTDEEIALLADLVQKPDVHRRLNNILPFVNLPQVADSPVKNGNDDEESDQSDDDSEDDTPATQKNTLEPLFIPHQHRRETIPPAQLSAGSGEYSPSRPKTVTAGIS